MGRRVSEAYDSGPCPSWREVRAGTQEGLKQKSWSDAGCRLTHRLMLSSLPGAAQSTCPGSRAARGELVLLHISQTGSHRHTTGQAVWADLQGALSFAESQGNGSSGLCHSLL